LSEKRLKLGLKVKVVKLVQLDAHNPAMKKYIGEVGKIVTILPKEWDLMMMYRIEFDNPDLEPLAFFAREIVIL
jgi:hypothetical protein